MFGPTAADSNPTGIVTTLQALMERLAAPDLTADEALTLRSRLLGLVDSIDSGQAGNPYTAADRTAVRGVNRCVVV